MKRKKTNILRDIMSGGKGHLSSKRIIGSIILLALTVTVMIKVFTGSDASWIGEVITALIVTAGAMIGVGVLDTAFSKKEKEEDNTEEL